MTQPLAPPVSALPFNACRLKRQTRKGRMNHKMIHSFKAITILLGIRMKSSNGKVQKAKEQNMFIKLDWIEEFTDRLIGSYTTGLLGEEKLPQHPAPFLCENKIREMLFQIDGSKQQLKTLDDET